MQLNNGMEILLDLMSICPQIVCMYFPKCSVVSIIVLSAFWGRMGWDDAAALSSK